MPIVVGSTSAFVWTAIEKDNDDALVSAFAGIAMLHGLLASLTNVPAWSYEKDVTDADLALTVVPGPGDAGLGLSGAF
jgi:hypothetical protein